MNTEEISRRLTETLKNSELQSLTADFSEIVLDNFIDNEMLKEVPIIKSLVGIKKGYSQINEQLFLKKVMAFLSQSKKIKAKQRCAMINKINNSKKYRVKIGEKLLYLIDKCDDWEKSELLSVFFNAFIESKISYEDFMKIAKIIEKLTIIDLKIFQKIVINNNDDFSNNDFSGEDGVDDLMNSGLFIYYIDEINIEDNEVYEEPRVPYKVIGGEMIIDVSAMGIKISEILNQVSF